MAKPLAALRHLWRSPLVWVALIGGAWYLLSLGDAQKTRDVPYSKVKQGIREGRFAEVVIANEWIQGELRPRDSNQKGGQREGEAPPGAGAAAQGDDARSWRAVRVPTDEQLVPLLEARDVPYRYVRTTELGPLLLWLIPLGLIVFWLMVMRRAASQSMAQGPGGLLAFGKSKARVQMESNTGVSFDDIAGIEEAVEELKEVVELLRSPERFRRLGAKIPKGLLLVGPPGTGKTLLARAVAGQAGVPFFSLSGSEFVEMFVGVGAARVRDLFKQAQAKAPCIVFVDELDALGKARSSGTGELGGSHEEREQTLNQLLSEMDGFDPRVGLIVLSATNRPEVLDPALLRPGRFDRQVLVDRPDREGRLAILRLHARGVVLGDEVDLEAVANRTPGFVGADLANLINEATLLAGRRDADEVQMIDFDDAIERVVAGLQKKNRRILDDERQVIAYHESGHALTSSLVRHGDPVHKVSIVPRGMQALGYTLQTPLDERYLMREDQLLDKLVALLGGRAAEEVVFRQVSTGGGNDLLQATELARRMVVEFGMSEVIGPLALGGQRQRNLLQPLDGGLSLLGRNMSDATAEAVDAEVRRIVTEQLGRARALLAAQRSALDAIAARLIEREAIGQAELEQLLAEHVTPSPVRPRTEPRRDAPSPSEPRLIDRPRDVFAG